MKSITILEFPSNLGLKQLKEDREPGVFKLPEHLRQNGFHDLLGVSICETLPRLPYAMDIDRTTQVRNGKKIITYALSQVDLLSSKIKDPNIFSLVLGGDCSILIGNAIALKENGRYGLFFLDGHTDFLWPEYSETGGAAGMDLGIVTGYGHNNLTDIKGLKPYFREEDVWCVGNRDFEEPYVSLIKNSNINYTDLHELRKASITTCVSRFLNHVESADLQGFWIHFDVDALSDSIMPLVDSRVPGGLTYIELEQLLTPLLSHKKVRGMDITILDPDLDEAMKYTRPFVKTMTRIIRSSLMQ